MRLWRLSRRPDLAGTEALALADAGWVVLVARGVIGVIFGVVAMTWPLSTVVGLAILWGVWALADGVSALVQAAQPGATRVRLAFAAMGVVALVAAVLAIFSPALTAVALTWVLGLWLLVRGSLECVLALVSVAPASRAGMFLSGLIDIGLGVLFVTNPGRSAIGVAVVLGLAALAWGVVLVVLGVAAWRNRPAPVTASGPT